MRPSTVGWQENFQMQDATGILRNESVNNDLLKTCVREHGRINYTCRQVLPQDPNWRMRSSAIADRKNFRQDTTGIIKNLFIKAE